MWQGFAGRSALMVTVALAVACGARPPAYDQSVRAPRRAVVWLADGGIDRVTAERLHRTGIDQLVQRRGAVDLAGSAPVLRLRTAAAVEGPIPVAVALEVTGVRDDLGRSQAEAVWRGLAAELDGAVPAELILDLPRLAVGLETFIVALSEVSGVAVVPLLSFEQLQTENGRRVAAAVRTCVVPAYGSDGADLRDIGELDPLPLVNKLESVARSGVRVRPAIVIRPRTEPPLPTLSEGLDTLTEDDATEVSTSSVLDRSFRFNRAMSWNGRRWDRGEVVAVMWQDASRLHAALTEIHRLSLPEVAGWDLVPIPPPDLALGLPRGTLVRYLGGEGPSPDLEVRVDRSGRSARAAMVNRGPFTSTVSRFGNWLQISVPDGWVSAREPGGFERVSRGTVRNGEWSEGDLERANAVRFYEYYLAPGETVVTGSVLLPSSRSRVVVRWNLTLSDGSKQAGEMTP